MNEIRFRKSYLSPEQRLLRALFTYYMSVRGKLSEFAGERANAAMLRRYRKGF